MYSLLGFLLLLGSVYATASSLGDTPQQSLNAYVAFMNHSVDEVASRFQQVQQYTEALRRYRTDGRSSLSLPSSGPLETHYYQKALNSNNSLTPDENQQLKIAAQALWQTLEKLDQTAKTLETYLRLKDYQRDGLKKSDELLREIQIISHQFSQQNDKFYQQIEQIHRRYQPYAQANAYLRIQKEMQQVLADERQLLQAWPYYLNEGSSSAWPVELVQQRVLASETVLATFGKGQNTLAYPASSMVPAFKEAIQSIQDVKRRAVNEYTFAAQQSAQHGNEVYLSLINYYNNDLLATYQSFVKYSTSEKPLLDYPKFCPVFELESLQQAKKNTSRTPPFSDLPLIPFTTKLSAAPADKATFQALTGYIEFINESLRQMNTMQLLVRDYQSSADYHRDPIKSQRRSALTYSHDAFKIPTADYQLLLNASQVIPQAYRRSINSQTEVLLNMLKEMDALSIELINYTQTKQYQQDGFRRSDEILDRYAYLFDTFDQKKEQLYQDVRRIHASYKVTNPTDSWHVSGQAMLETLDEDKTILFALKAYLKGERNSLPNTDNINALARKLITDEYQNLKGLTRYGRSNGLCPYSPYEDLAENSIRFGEKAQRLKSPTPNGASSYEEFYYFYNGELVYQYNKFGELAKANVLKAVNQPNLFAFRRTKPGVAQPGVAPPTVAQTPTPETKPVVTNPPPTTPTVSENKTPIAQAPNNQSLQRDTVFLERTKTDTVYIERNSQTDDLYTLKGFAANNMVLLLDVSASMNSPFKMPLLKKSIKSLLQLLRPEDQISVVIYSGKAKLALKTTSGSAVAQIAQAIDQLESDGDTDGNAGIRLAYKVANKSYIRGGNNRIILATDGEFPISEAVYELVAENAQQDVFLTVFTFNRKEINSASLKKLATMGKGSCDHITPQNADLRLILEARAKKMP